MDCDELLALLTLAAVAPYLAEAATRWIKAGERCKKDADAHSWCDCRHRGASR